MTKLDAKRVKKINNVDKAAGGVFYEVDKEGIVAGAAIREGKDPNMLCPSVRMSKDAEPVGYRDEGMLARTAIARTSGAALAKSGKRRTVKKTVVKRA